MAALAAETARDLHRHLVSGVAAALGHLLRQQAWARERLQQHAGSLIQIRLDMPSPLAGAGSAAGTFGAGLPQPVFAFRVSAEGLLDPVAEEDPADACLRLRPSAAALADLLRGQGVDSLTRDMRVEGDVRLAASLAELARHLRWDVEEDLSRLLGDVLAHRAVGLLRGGLRHLADLPAALRSAAQGLPGNANQGAALGPLATGRAWRELSEESQALQARLHRLEQRLMQP